MSLYNDLHRYFLQAMMSRAIVTREGARKLLTKIAQLVGFHHNIKDDELPEFLKEVNFKVSSFGMELKEILDEHDGGKYIVLVNTTDSSAVMEKIPHVYSEKERELFRLLLENIVNNDDNYGSVSTMEAMHLHVTGMRPGDIQEALTMFVADKWFVETSSGRLVPAARCIAEFNTYFKKNFEDYIQICILCSNVVFYGVECPGCSAISHKHCFKLFNSRKSENKCPTCKVCVIAEPQNGAGEKRTAGSSRKGQTTPENTPGPSQRDNSTVASSQDETPVPTRGRRKRPSAE